MRLLRELVEQVKRSVPELQRFESKGWKRGVQLGVGQLDVAKMEMLQARRALEQGGETSPYSSHLLRVEQTQPSQRAGVACFENGDQGLRFEAGST